MLRFANVATPAVAAWVVVPVSVPEPGFVPRDSVTLPVKVVTVFPSVSRAVTWTAGVIAAPATALAGWTVKTRRVAAAGAMLNALLVSPGRPPAGAASG